MGQCVRYLERVVSENECMFYVWMYVYGINEHWLDQWVDVGCMNGLLVG